MTLTSDLDFESMWLGYGAPMSFGDLGRMATYFQGARSTGNYFRGARGQAHNFGDLGSPAKKQNM